MNGKPTPHRYYLLNPGLVLVPLLQASSQQHFPQKAYFIFFCVKCSSLPLQLNIKNPTSHWQRIHKDMEQTASQNLEGNTEENKPGCGNEPADFTAHSRASSFLPSLQGMHLLPAWGVHKMMFILSPFLATFNLTFSSLRLHLYQHLLQSNIYTSDSISRYHLDGGTGFHPGASSILGKKANPELQPQPFFKFFIFSLYSPGWL